ncbi:hypothetical protein F4808DRAFT_246452 [Astrocystis sublimbata]|nr:hypothetical protein F4808DRAFT_246452 [Astrocystis sublimbata]
MHRMGGIHPIGVVPNAEDSTTRQSRLHVVSFHGTWAGGVLVSQPTVVSEFVGLISQHENVFEISINGVGTDINIINRFLGGLSGLGTLHNVITAYSTLSKHYGAGDRITLCGYSRGAWAARYLAKLIEIIGLPKNGNEKHFNLLYKACDNNSIFDKDLAAHLCRDKEHWPDVQIDALCCFDTVGSLGVPLFGLAKPLVVLRRLRRRKPDIISDVAQNVRFAFHCVSLHEKREPFSPTLMRGRNVHQVYFSGTHSAMGWIDEQDGLVHAPLAWMIQQLQSHLHLRFDEAKLAARFPSYRAQAQNVDNPSASANLPSWCRGSIAGTSKLRLAVMGTQLRQPGFIDYSEHTSSGQSQDDKSDPCPLTYNTTQSLIHVGARLRICIDDNNAVPGYTMVLPTIGRHHWELRPGEKLKWRRRRSPHLAGTFYCQKPSSTTSESSSEAITNFSLIDNDFRNTSSPRNSSSRSSREGIMADIIQEAPIGSLEASLLGLPSSVVSSEFCCAGAGLDINLELCG